MLRAFTLLIAFATAAAAQLHVLGPGRDVNEAVNPGRFTIVQWPGGANAQLVAVDVAKDRLILADYRSVPWNQHTTFRAVLKEGVPPDSHVISASIDQDGYPDVVLLHGDDAYLWKSTERGVDGSWPSPTHLKLPAPIPSERYGWQEQRPEVADFDNDGWVDLLIPPEYLSTGGVIFSFGRENSEWVPVSFPDLSGLSAAPAWAAGDPSTLCLHFAVPVDSGFFQSYEHTTRLFRFSSSRDLEEIPNTSFKGSGSLVALEASYPPELVEIATTTSPYPTLTATIRRHTGDAWEVTTDLKAPHTGNLYPPLHQVNVGHYSRQEVLIVVDSSTSAEYWKLSATSEGPSLARVRGAMPGNIASVSAIEDPSDNGRSKLAITRKSFNRHYFEGPFYARGVGTTLTLGDDFTFFANKQVVETVTGELNGDGLPDLLVSREDGFALPILSPDLSVTLAPMGEPVSYYFDPTSILLNDDDGDGRDDPLFLNPGGVHSFLTTGSAGSPPAFQHRASTYLDWLAPHSALGNADFDGDGDDDLLFFHWRHETIAWVENTGGGNYGTIHQIAMAGRIRDPIGVPGQYRWIGRNQVLTGDFDGDGDVDIITCPSGLGNRVALHRNQGGSFTLEPLTPSFEDLPGHPHPYVNSYELATIKQGHFFRDHEGIQFALAADTVDEMTGYYTSAVWLVRLTPDGPVISPKPITFGEDLYATIAVADFDGDGLDDLIAGGNEYDPMGMSFVPKLPSLLYRRNNGDGTFGPVETLGKPSGFATAIEAKDFDGDGRCDVLVTSTHTGTIELFSHRIAPAPASYSSWCQLHGVSADEVNADDDHDGVANIFEYAAGTSPSIPNAPSGASLKIQNFAEGDILTYTRPRLPSGTSVEIDAEYSLDLQQWHPAPRAPEVSVHMDSPDRENMRWKILPNEVTAEGISPTMFYRFKARKPAEQ